MTILATAIAALDVVFWIALILVAVVLVSALARGTIEDIKDHRRIVAARIARGISPPPSAWQRAIWMPKTRTIRSLCTPSLRS